MKQTSHWYLPMERHEEWLKEWIKQGTLDGVQQHDPKQWRNQVIGQCLSWIDGGLRPRAMTRDLDWGVPVPLKDAEGNKGSANGTITHTYFSKFKLDIKIQANKLICLNFMKSEEKLGMRF